MADHIFELDTENRQIKAVVDTARAVTLGHDADDGEYCNACGCSFTDEVLDGILACDCAPECVGHRVRAVLAKLD